MEFVINSDQLRKALKEIERAEKNGFMHCQSVFELVRAGQSLSDNIANFTEILEKAHPTDGSLDWGRGQHITKRFKFVKGKLVELK
tara:strand:- start:228 stop:485 length:258 start_codon:yes stop_codon:yes gene_type:complete